MAEMTITAAGQRFSRPVAVSVSPNFETTVERLRVCREADDRSRWVAGDTVLLFVGNVERSKIGETLDALAAHSGFHRAGLRERYDCSRFWPPESRRWNDVATWSHYNRARRGVDFETACGLMEQAEAGAMSVAAFELHCQTLKGRLPPDPATEWRALAERLDAQAADYQGELQSNLLFAASELRQAAEAYEAQKDGAA